MWSSFREGLNASALALRLSYDIPFSPHTDAVVDLNRRAKRLWEALTPMEQAAVREIHILENDVRQRDAGVFSHHIRLARNRVAIS